MQGQRSRALVEKHLRIVDHFAAKYRQSAPHADLEAAGALALCEAARRFKPRKGYAFSTYAWNWVRGSMISEIRRSHVVPVPEHTARAANRQGRPITGVVKFITDGDLPDSEPCSDPPDATADRSMRLRAIHEAIEQLPDPRHRHVINRTLAGRSVEQIALGMGLPETQVESLLEQARGELEWLLNE